MLSFPLLGIEDKCAPQNFKNCNAVKVLDPAVSTTGHFKCDGMLASDQALSFSHQPSPRDGRGNRVIPSNTQLRGGFD